MLQAATLSCPRASGQRCSHKLEGHLFNTLQLHKARLVVLGLQQQRQDAVQAGDRALAHGEAPQPVCQRLHSGCTFQAVHVILGLSSMQDTRLERVTDIPYTVRGQLQAATAQQQSIHCIQCRASSSSITGTGKRQLTSTVPALPASSLQAGCTKQAACGSKIQLRQAYNIDLAALAS